MFKKMLQYREWYRTTFKISPGSNVAVFHFKYPNGAEGYWAIHSDPGQEHRAGAQGPLRAPRVPHHDPARHRHQHGGQDAVGARDLHAPAPRLQGADGARVPEDGDRTPAPVPGRQGGARREHEGAQGGEPGPCASSTQAQADHEPGGGRQGGGGALARMLGSGRLGGIDFSSLELRYVSDKGGDLGYAFRAPSSATPGDPAAGLDDRARVLGRVLHVARAAAAVVLGEPQPERSRTGSSIRSSRAPTRAACCSRPTCSSSGRS